MILHHTAFLLFVLQLTLGQQEDGDSEMPGPRPVSCRNFNVTAVCEKPCSKDFTFSDGCNNCFCMKGGAGCTKRGCPNEGSTEHCNLLLHNVLLRLTHYCNRGPEYIDCPDIQPQEYCNRNGTHGFGFSDGCNSCGCAWSTVDGVKKAMSACTLMGCIKKGTKEECDRVKAKIERDLARHILQSTSKIRKPRAEYTKEGGSDEDERYKQYHGPVNEFVDDSNTIKNAGPLPHFHFEE